MSAPQIAIRNHEGGIVAIGPAAAIRDHLNGKSPITLTVGKVAGDTIWLAPRTEQVWRDDAITVETTNIAYTLDHPEHGEILAAWVDMDRLADAPQITEIRTARHRATLQHAAAQEAEAARIMRGED